MAVDHVPLQPGSSPISMKCQSEGIWRASAARFLILLIAHTGKAKEKAMNSKIAKDGHWRGAGRYEPGKSGNPAGRKVGSRNKLGEQFLSDMLEDWKVHGSAAIATFRADRPHDYVKVVASLLPREVNVKVNELDELTDEQLAQQLAAAIAQLAAASADPGAGAGEAEAPQPAGGIPTIQ